MPRRRPVAARVTAKVTLDRRALEAFQLEARELAGRLGISVTKISIRRPARRSKSVP